MVRRLCVWTAGTWNDDLRLFTWLLALLLVTVATPIAAADSAPIGVRTGEHAGFSRIVFDWTVPVGATYVP